MTNTWLRTIRLGRKPSFTREQFVKVRAMLGQQAVGIAQIANETGLTRQMSTELRMTLRALRRLWLFGDCEGAASGMNVERKRKHPWPCSN